MAPFQPTRMLTWEPNNYPFVGEDVAGNIGCYLCGQRHFTTEHINRSDTTRRRSEPPPNYPDSLSPQRQTVYETIPEQDFPSTSTPSTSSLINSQRGRRIRQRLSENNTSSRGRHPNRGRPC